MVDETVQNEADRRRGRRWWGVAALTLPALLASMDLSVLFMAAPWLSADLAPSGTQLLWIMDVYGFAMAGLLITMGAWGDRIGRRRLLLAGAALFGAASVLAAFASTPETLVLARALLGVGGATLAPSTLALIRTMFPDDGPRRAAIGVWTAAFTGGVVIGPIVGGVLLEHFWWGSVFLINVPVMAALLLVGPVLLPESRDPGRPRPDVASAVLSLLAVTATIYGVKEFAAGTGGPMPVTGLIIGTLAGVLFVRRQQRARAPLIELALFGRRGFGAALSCQAVVVAASAGMGFLAVQFVQLVLGLRPFTAALWMLPTIAGTVAGIVLATTAVRWVRTAVPVGTGLLLAATGFLLLTTISATSTVPAVMAAYTVLTFGTGLVAPLAVDLIVSTAPPERAGAASALGETSAEFGGAVGIAILGTAAAAIYRTGLADTAPPELLVTRDAADTLGGALQIAPSLPDPTAAVTAATDAFVCGFSTAAALAAVLLVVSAAVVTARLWNTAPTGEPR
ncbi:MFS transporter [Pseudonocardia sp. NPDC049635]|uniref:MFS transporter n=1 Tax=Pseudonocardia sp. NPDC049635 TaxID=3155506 RepID=UPI0034119788